MTRPRDQGLLVIIVTALVAIAALVLSLVALARATPSTSPARPGPLSGLYANGALDQPHYYVTLHESDDGKVSGALGFVFQDGQSSVAFTFKGTTTPLGQRDVTGMMVVATTIVKEMTTSLLTSKVPSSISMPYDSTSFEIGECETFLDVSSLAGCHFNVDRSHVI